MFSENKKISNETLSQSLNKFITGSSKKVDFAIFSAMEDELEFIEKYLSGHKGELVNIGDFNFKIYIYHNKRILLAQTGMGTTFAASMLTFVHIYFRPTYVFLTGTAGGIKPGLKIRDVVIVDKAFEAEIQDAFKLLEGTPFASCLKHPLKKEHFPSIYSANQGLLDLASNIDCPGVRAYIGTVVSSNAFPAPQELFEKIKSYFPFSIDMETSAFYQVAWLLNISVLAVRGISNILQSNGTDNRISESDVKGSAEAAAKVLLKIIHKLLLKYDLTKYSPEFQNPDVAKLIQLYKLAPHPEGGFYSRSFKSNDEIKSLDKVRYNDEVRAAGTAIYYLLNGNEFSAWHCLKSDEIWHYCKGSPVKIHVINREGALKTFLLADSLAYSEGHFQVAIRAGEWFAAEVLDKSSYSFVGCTVSPGFDFKDFKLADRASLSMQFPKHEVIIKQFTRLSRQELPKTKKKELVYESLVSRL